MHAIIIIVQQSVLQNKSQKKANYFLRIVCIHSGIGSVVLIQLRCKDERKSVSSLQRINISVNINQHVHSVRNRSGSKPSDCKSMQNHKPTLFESLSIGIHASHFEDFLKQYRTFRHNANSKWFHQGRWIHKCADSKEQISGLLV